MHGELSHADEHARQDHLEDQQRDHRRKHNGCCTGCTEPLSLDEINRNGSVCDECVRQMDQRRATAQATRDATERFSFVNQPTKRLFHPEARRLDAIESALPSAIERRMAEADEITERRGLDNVLDAIEAFEGGGA